METKEQMLYRINRINRNNLMNELNMKRKKLIVKYNPKELNKDELPKSQREFINYKKKFNKQLLKNKQIMNPDFINISSFKPEERKLIVGDKDEELIGSLLISDEVKQENYNKIDELFKKNLTPSLMDFQTYTYVNQQIGDDYVYKNMINNNIVGIEKKLRDKYKSLTPTQFLYEINKYFQEPQTSQPISSPSQYIPLINYTPSQKLYYDTITKDIKKLKGDKNTLSKYKKIESNINDIVLQNLIIDYNNIIDNDLKNLIDNIDETIQKYNDELNEIRNYKDDDITEFLKDFNNRIKEIEDNYNNINEDLFNLDKEIKDKIEIKKKQEEGLTKLSEVMKKKDKDNYRYVINKLKENRDNQQISEEIKDYIDNMISYIQRTMENPNLSDKNKEDILMDEVKEVNEVLINNNIEPIKLSEEEKIEKEKIEKLIGSIEKSQKSIYLQLFLNKLDEYMKQKKIVMNSIIKKIVEEAINKVKKIESDKDLTIVEKEEEVNIILENTKKKLTDNVVRLQTNIINTNLYFDYAINKQPNNEDLKKIQKTLNSTKTYEEFLKTLEEIYSGIFPTKAKSKKQFQTKIEEILIYYDFSKEELSKNVVYITQSEELMRKVEAKIIDFSKKIKKFIEENKDNKDIENEIKLLNNIFNIVLIEPATTLENDQNIKQYRENLFNIYDNLRNKKISKELFDNDENPLPGISTTELPDLSKNKNIMKMVSKIYDVYLGNITDAINKPNVKETENIKATKENLIKLFGKKKELLDETSTQDTMTMTEEKIPEKKENKKKKLTN